eukprot:5454442-Prymnesium_polylepis.1
MCGARSDSRLRSAEFTIARREHVARAVVVLVVVDRVADGERRGQHAVEEADPVVEDVAERPALVVRSHKEAGARRVRVALLVADGVHVGEVHEEGSDPQHVVHVAVQQRRARALGRQVEPAERRERQRQPDAHERRKVDEVRVVRMLHELRVEGLGQTVEPRDEPPEDEAGQLVVRLDQPSLEAAIDGLPQHRATHHNPDRRTDEGEGERAKVVGGPLLPAVEDDLLAHC